MASEPRDQGRRADAQRSRREGRDRPADGSDPLDDAIDSTLDSAIDSLAQRPLMRLLTSLGSYAQTRAELALLEWETERERLLQALLRGVLGALIAVLALGLASAALLIAMPESWRAWAALGLAVLFGVLAWWLFGLVGQAVAQPSFAALRDEIDRDRQPWRAYRQGPKAGASAREHDDEPPRW